MSARPTSERPGSWPDGRPLASREGRRASNHGELELLFVLVGISALLLAWTYPLWGPQLHAACPLRTLTGIPCPTCGGTRAIVAAARGDWIAALRFNPMLGIAGIALVLGVPLLAGMAVGEWRRPAWDRLATPFVLRLVAAAALANWLYLIVAAPL